jgi:hypothetical protein
MEEHDGNAAAARCDSPTRKHQADWKCLAILLFLAAVIHGWHIGHTEVAARDGVGFIRYAWQLETRPLGEVLRENLHPPLYPLAALAMSYPVRHLLPGNEIDLMQLSAQLASAVAGVLLVIPMYYLGKEFFDRRVGFWAALLFQCFPCGSRVLADVLTEGTFLFLTATALLLAVQAFRFHSWPRFALCGFFGGLAYLTRPEGMMVVVSAGMVVIGAQLVRPWRRPWRHALMDGGALALSAMAVSLPYMAVIGRFTNKTTGQEILQTASDRQAIESPVTAADERSRPQKKALAIDGSGSPLMASLLGIYGKESKEFTFLHRHFWCLVAIGREIAKGYYYVAWLPALLALCWFWNRSKMFPGSWVLACLAALHVVLLWRLAYVAGYVAERHSLMLILCSMAWAVAGVFTIGEHLSWLGRRLTNWKPAANAVAWSTLLLVALACYGLPKTLETLHPSRAGFHAAGLWLGERVQSGDFIMDPFSWTEYYAGQVYRQVHEPVPPLAGHTMYVVMGGTKNEHERLPLMVEARKWYKHGAVAYHWQPKNSKAEEVLVYQLQMPADTH